LRRDLGPLAWCALECLVEHADADGVVEASVRTIAVELRVAKNTAHRALRILSAAGLVAAEQRRVDDGRFGAGRYRLHVGDLLADSPGTSPEPRPVRRRANRPVDDGQLSLLPGA
jgi:DNA-binding IclR family transcriptional regulator